MQHVYHQLKAQDKNCALKHINFICRYARWNLKSSEAAVRRSGQFPKALNDRTLLPRTLCPHEDPSLNSRPKVRRFENLLRLYPKKYAKILNPSPKAHMPKPKPFLNPALSNQPGAMPRGHVRIFITTLSTSEYSLIFTLNLV